MYRTAFNSRETNPSILIAEMILKLLHWVLLKERDMASSAVTTNQSNNTWIFTSRGHTSQQPLKTAELWTTALHLLKGSSSSIDCSALHVSNVVFAQSMVFWYSMPFWSDSRNQVHNAGIYCTMYILLFKVSYNVCCFHFIQDNKMWLDYF